MTRSFYALALLILSGLSSCVSTKDISYLQDSDYSSTQAKAVVLPIVSELRVFVEGLLGASLASARYTEPGLATLHAREWLGLALLSGGLQWRVLYQLSLGVRVSLALNPSGLTGVARYAGLHDGGRLALTGGVTWHF